MCPRPACTGVKTAVYLTIGTFKCRKGVTLRNFLASCAIVQVLRRGARHPNYNVMSTSCISCRFEVFGKVQGVSFRQYTLKKASSLELKGWCMNTAQGTVTGEMQGPQARFRIRLNPT